jgi:hypothetical protein
MAWVWKHAPIKGTDLLILLAIADHASEDGGNAYPSIKTISVKARVSQERVRQGLRRLEEKGLLLTASKQGGTDNWRNDRRPNRYTVIMNDPNFPSLESITTATSEATTPTNDEYDPNTAGDKPSNINHPEINHPLPLPKSVSAKAAVERVQSKLASARQRGVNAWNLGSLIMDEWDLLHQSGDDAGAVALMCWYTSEMLARPLTGTEFARSHQLIKRFGRLGFIGLETAISKQLEDPWSYAFKASEGMHREAKK